jgi:hypothetical protein
MKKKLAAAALIMALPFAASQADAAGCIKGAIVGGIAGHYAHPHAILGAMTGCVVGHHLAAEKAKQAQQQRIAAKPAITPSSH